MVALQVVEELRRSGTLEKRHLYEKVRSKLLTGGHITPDEAGRKAQAAVNEVDDYELNTDGALLRLVWSPLDDQYRRVMVIPAGGLRAFYYNGRKYELPVRKMLLLQYHDSPTEGGHASAEDTASKLQRMVWWPHLKRDVTRWVATCSVCRLTKPTARMTPEMRTELFQRPFRTIEIDAFGPARGRRKGVRVPGDLPVQPVHVAERGGGRRSQHVGTLPRGGRVLRPCRLPRDPSQRPRTGVHRDAHR